MDREEREEIPWSALVAEAESGVDRRWYVVATVVGVLVATVLGFRLLGGSPQPNPLVIASEDSTTSSSTAAESSVPSAPAVIVAESELIAGGNPATNRVTELIAEMFVTDYFTNDGADETMRSVVAAVSPGLRPEVEAARSALEDASFVEWAKVFAIDPPDDGVTVVRVAYRAIVATADGFDRLPVAAVEVRVASGHGSAPSGTGAIVSLPTPINPP
jgi:hypothetical protein